MTIIKAIRTQQSSVTLYVGVITAEQLIQIGVTDEWDSAKGWNLDTQGYQRQPIPKHYNAIAKFLETSSPTLPTAALLSAREQDQGDLNKTEIAENVFNIEIPNGRVIYIVDYQHRWRGFIEAIKKASGLKTFNIPFVMMANASRFEEMHQFYLVNNKQKRVDTDLAIALMLTLASDAQKSLILNLLGPGKKYLMRATRITFGIVGKTTGEWAGRIEIPNMPLDSRWVASPKSFADSLKPFLTKTSLWKDLTDTELEAGITNLWTALKGIMPKAFEQPQKYSLQRTPGIYVFHRLAAECIFPMCEPARDFSVRNLSNILELARSRAEKKGERFFKETFWRQGSDISAFSAFSGHKKLFLSMKIYF